MTEEGPRTGRIMSEETGRNALSPFAPPQIAQRRNSASREETNIMRREDETFANSENVVDVSGNGGDDRGSRVEEDKEEKMQGEPSEDAEDFKKEDDGKGGKEEERIHLEDGEVHEQNKVEMSETEGHVEDRVDEVDTNSLSMLLNSLTFHPEVPPSFCITIETILNTSLLIKEGPLSFREENLSSSSSSSLWPTSLSRSSSSSPLYVEKNLHLFSDAILLTVPQEDGSNLFEDYIDMSSTRVQIRCDDYNNMLQQQEGEFIDVFEILFGAKTLEVKTKSREGRDDWIDNLVDISQDHVPEDSKLIGWKHFVRLGTIHSAILMRDTLLIERFKEYCEEGLIEYMIFDLVDEDGCTPLHLACAHSIHYIIDMLLEVNVDVMSKDNLGRTALHYCALLLDDCNLEKLCGRIFDIELVDDLGFTPLTIACVAGRDPGSGEIDITSLRRCVEILMAMGANLLESRVRRFDPETTSVIDVSLLEWACKNWNVPLLTLIARFLDREELRGLLCEPHNKLLFDVFCCQKIAIDIQVSPPFSQPSAADIDTFNLIKISQMLIDNGARLNAPMTGVYPDLTLMELVAKSYMNFRDHFIDILKLLVGNGARTDNAPTLKALRQKWSDIDEALETSTTIWQNKGVLSTSGVNIERMSLEKDESTKKMCQCCGFTFTFFKRKQKCSICNLGYCDACSRKKVSSNDTSNARCCDSCYNRINKLCGEESERLFMAGQLKNLPSSSSIDNQKDLDIKKKKEDLMRGAVKVNGSSGNPRGESTSDKKKASEIYSEGGMSALKAHLGEAHDKLQQRGEKLSELNDKSDRLKSSANEFAKLAQQLNKDRANSWW